MEKSLAASESVDSTDNFSKSFIIEMFALLFSVVLGCSLYYGFVVWQKQKTEEVLNTSANGATTVYQDRAQALRKIMLLSHSIQQTRAPGTYLSALREWQRASVVPTSANKASWVYELEMAEHGKVQELLATHGVTLADIALLESKLLKVSPQLTEAEEALLEKITTTHVLADLAWTRDTTVGELFKKLKDLGASDTGLRAQYMRHPNL